jgi:hypothetical protein
MAFAILTIGCGDDDKGLQGGAESDVSGIWNTTFGGAVDSLGNEGENGYATLTLKERKGKVTGEYNSTGRITIASGDQEGTITDGILKGTWKDESFATGTFEFKFDEQMKSFTGSWKSQDLQGKWNGKRK